MCSWLWKISKEKSCKKIGKYGTLFNFYGCQSKYGDCRYAEELGSLPDVFCCDQYRWYESDSNYCSVSNGLQSKLYKMNSKKKYRKNFFIIIIYFTL